MWKFRVAAALIVIPGLSACGGGSSAANSNSEAACAASIVYNGVQFIGVTLHYAHPRSQVGVIPKSHMQEVGDGKMPACLDSNDVSPPGRTVMAARIKGYDPHQVIADYSTGDVYLAAGSTLPKSLVRASWIKWTTP